jgi:hypothetical protein
MYTVSVLLIKALLVVGLHELLVPRKAKWSSVTRVALASQPTAVTQVLLRRADKLIRNDRRLTNLQLSELSLSKGSVNNIIDAFGYSKVCALWVP